MLARYLALILCASLLSASPVSSSAADGPRPSTPCGISVPKTTESTSAKGQKKDNEDDADDLEEATQLARRRIIRKLGRESGVVCSICEDGIQCQRNISVTESFSFESEQISCVIDGEVITGYEVFGTYVGAYMVTCDSCEA